MQQWRYLRQREACRQRYGRQGSVRLLSGKVVHTLRLEQEVVRIKAIVLHNARRHFIVL